MKIKELAEKLNNASSECYEDLKNGNFISFKDKESPKKVVKSNPVPEETVQEK